MKRLKDKVAVVYGNGAIGGAVTMAFAQEGAKVFLAGRSEDKLNSIQNQVESMGGVIKTTQLDATDEQAINMHMDDIVQTTGKVNISFNAIGIPQRGIQGTALKELSLDNFMLPVSTYLTSHFLTAKAAIPHMLSQGNGVILMHTPNARRTSNPFVGGMVPTWAAMEALCRSFSVEYAALGVRAVCLHTTGIPETALIDEVWDIHGKSHGISFDDFHAVMEGGTHRKHLTKLDEMTSAAVFVASDEGSGITGTTFNLTAGMVF